MIAAALGCSGRDKLDEGDACEVNTECVAPLVCRFERCRPQCRETRDCEVGRTCVIDIDTGFGACQLLTETECILASDCPGALVCSFRRCTNACGSNRDCPGGAACVNDAERGNVCLDMSGMACELSSDCAEPLACARDGRCRPECREDRDCRAPQTCDRSGAVAVCSGAAVADAGASVDGGP